VGYAQLALGETSPRDQEPSTLRTVISGLIFPEQQATFFCGGVLRKLFRTESRGQLLRKIAPREKAVTDAHLLWLLSDKW